MKVKCAHCPYECILETKQDPKYSDIGKFATVCVYNAGNVKWELIKEEVGESKG